MVNIGKIFCFKKLSYSGLLFKISVILLAYGCDKNKSDCHSELSDIPSFSILEKVGDTILETDSAYANRYVYFRSNTNADSVRWNIGSDIRDFSSKDLNLIFGNEGLYNINLSAFNRNNCRIIQPNQKQLQIIKDDGTFVSPLVGTYRGFDKDNITDVFQIEIKFWIGDHYDWWPTGAYSIQNFPKDYFDNAQTFNGHKRPEITGIICATGYKNMTINEAGYLPAQGVKAYISFQNLHRDTLTINYNIIDTSFLSQTGNIIYRSKQFIGYRIN